ncbi:MAG: hypothetical protein RMJ05_07560 [Thermomicrobium sp.]|nr:hypothetical protein [Thermomicrobium sp.]
MARDVLDYLAGLATGIMLAVVNWALRRRQEQADVLERYQRVVDSLWQRIEELERQLASLEQRTRELETELERVRRLLAAYERRFGRRFRIHGDRIVELSSPSEPPPRAPDEEA